VGVAAAPVLSRMRHMESRGRLYKPDSKYLKVRRRMSSLVCASDAVSTQVKAAGSTLPSLSIPTLAAPAAACGLDL